MVRRQQDHTMMESSDPLLSRGCSMGWMISLMIGLSGFSCLIYQILWMRELGLLFGNSAHAGALTLGVFFSGLAFGSWWWGQKCTSIQKPLRLCALLEFGIACCAVVTLLASKWIEAIYPIVYERHGKGMMTMVFMLLGSWIMIFPSAFLMGGSLPMIGQSLIRDGSSLGRKVARMYAINTLGAALGAFAAAFVLIGTFGIRMTCGIAMMVSILAGIIALGKSKNEIQSHKVNLPAAVESSPRGKGILLSRWQIRVMAFFSGFSVLGLEVLWTRLMAQIHENSVYGFSTILVVVLICLAGGSLIASYLARKDWNTAQILSILFTAAGISLCAIPYAFHSFTNGGTMVPTDSSFARYIMSLFGVGMIALGPASLVLGTIFPYLMKAEQAYAGEAGRSIGLLSAVNTMGAVIGALVSGFYLLEWLGLWRSIQVMASGYFLVALFLPFASVLGSVFCKAVSFVMLGFAFVIFSQNQWANSAKLARSNHHEVVLETWNASDCKVTVVKDSRNDVAIKINENYGLGSRLAYTSQIFQTRIPMLAFPRTNQIFYLGMGTGITAGEALDRSSFPNVEKVVACELSASVISASKKYFAGGDGSPDLTNGLYHDTRATVIHADGRNHLMATTEQFAMINADLFLPYRRGTGNLYSKEHFANVRRKLSPRGVFVQWIPLYQVSENEFGIIARTMLEVFPQVTLWRGNFMPGAETAALIGHVDSSPIPPSELDTLAEQRHAVAGKTHRNISQIMLPTNEQTIPFFYGGNVTMARHLFTKYPVNCYDHPVIEFALPRSLHRETGSEKPHFLENRFADLVDQLLEHTPPELDPMLALRSNSNRKLPQAGAAFHRASIAGVRRNEDEALRQWQKFLHAWLWQPSDEIKKTNP